MFSGNRCGDYISKMALKSSNTKNTALQMLFLILKLAH